MSLRKLKDIPPSHVLIYQQRESEFIVGDVPGLVQWSH